MKPDVYTHVERDVRKTYNELSSWMTKHMRHSDINQVKEFLLKDFMATFILDYYSQYWRNVVSKSRVIKITLGYQFKVSN